MFRRRLFALLACALVSALVAAGCGSDSGDTATASISKAEFVKQANATCEKGREKLHTDYLVFSREKNGQRVPSRAEYEEYIDRVVAPNLNRLGSQISALEVPEGDEDQIEALLAAIDEGLENAEAKPESVLANNAEIFSKAIKLATAYDLAACAETF
jgi:hypothetical protein